MNSTTQSGSEHDEIISQLPWLVNGTLSESEAMQLKKHVELCESCRGEVESLTNLYQVLRDAPADEPNTSASLARMRQRIAADKPRGSIQSQLQTKFESIWHQLAPSHRGAWALASVCILAAVLFVFQSQTTPAPGSEGPYQVLSSDVQDTQIQLYVRLDETLSSSEVKTVLDELQQLGDFTASPIEHQKNSFKLAMDNVDSDTSLSPAALTEFIDTLLSKKGIVDAGISQ
ncbi:MAG: anti-sigma factor [Granulosicoccus sp.]